MKRLRLRLQWILILCCLPAWAQGSKQDELAQDAAAGQQAMSHGDFAAARAYFEKLEQLEPHLAEVHATLAAICFKQRDYDHAITEIHAAQRLKPALPKLDSLLGLSLAESGKVRESLPYLEKGFHQTADPDVRRMCGLELLRAYGNLDRDADAVETALALNKAFPNDPEVLYHTGRVYGSFAYTVMEKLHNTAPGSVWMLQAQGEANESQSNWDAAIVAFNHVLALEPNRPGIHYQLGRVYLGRFHDSAHAEDRDAAMHEFSTELTIDPGNGNAAYELAYLETEAGNLDDAAKQYGLILQRYPDFEEALVGLAGIDLTNQKPDQAVPLLEQATRLRPDDEVAWWRLAQADRITGNIEGQQKALTAFRKIHEVTPQTLRNPNTANEVTPQKLGPDANP